MDGASQQATPFQQQFHLVIHGLFTVYDLVIYTCLLLQDCGYACGCVLGSVIALQNHTTAMC